MLKRYKIIVAYDGTDYFGWQEQTVGPTIAGVLQRSFKKVFKKEIKLSAVSRTDAGVHALGQVATFLTDLVIAPDALMLAWNNKLPESILIRQSEEVPVLFSPHKNVVEKEYRYRFTLVRQLPEYARFVTYYSWPVDLQKLQEACKIFIGTHDFRSFCCSEYTGNTIRTVNEITITCAGDVYTITFKAPAFLRHMIRRIVGACLCVASRKALSIDYLKTNLLNCNPEHTLETAPARGLTLVGVRYKQ